MVKPHEGECLIKALLGIKTLLSPLCNIDSQKQILECLNTVIECGNVTVIDLRKNSGMKLKFEEFWQVLYNNSFQSNRAILFPF